MKIWYKFAPNTSATRRASLKLYSKWQRKTASQERKLYSRSQSEFVNASVRRKKRRKG